MSKASKRRLMLLGSLSIMAIIYFGYVLVSYTTNIIKLSNEEKRLEAHLLSLKEEEERLKTEIVKLNDPDYVARYARENFLYSKDGEYIIRIDALNQMQEETESPVYNSNLIIGLTVFIVFLITLVLIRKRKKANN